MLVIVATSSESLPDSGPYLIIRKGLIQYNTRCYFNVRSKVDMSRLNLPHGNDN